MPPPPCSKCRQSPASEGDLWCNACTAWEALGRELCANWEQTGVRIIAADLVINVTRQVRSLRSLSAGLASEAGRAPRAGTGRAQPASRASHSHRPREDSLRREELPRRRPPEPAGPPPRSTKVERGDTEEEDESDLQEEEEEEPAQDPPQTPWSRAEAQTARTRICWSEGQESTSI